MALLQLVRHLVIDSMPTDAVCTYMHAWNLLTLEHQPRQSAERRTDPRILFENVTTIAFSAQAVWDFACWINESENWCAPDHLWDRSPPVLRTIFMCARPEHVCWEFPKRGWNWYSEWMLLFERRDAEYVQRSTEEDGRQMHQAFQMEYEGDFNRLQSQLAKQAALSPSCRSITVHVQQSGHVPFGVEKIRLFLPKDYVRSNSPYGKAKSTEVDDNHEQVLEDLVIKVCAYRRGKFYYYRDHTHAKCPRHHSESWLQSLAQKIVYWEIVCFSADDQDSSSFDSRSELPSNDSTGNTASAFASHTSDSDDSASYTSSDEEDTWWDELNACFERRYPRWQKEDAEMVD
ncbi:hypothetical protein IAU59_006447 [Kwoniella sp. CBS 9459]